MRRGRLPRREHMQDAARRACRAHGRAIFIGKELELAAFADRRDHGLDEAFCRGPGIAKHERHATDHGPGIQAPDFTFGLDFLAPVQHDRMRSVVLLVRRMQAAEHQVRGGKGEREFSPAAFGGKGRGGVHVDRLRLLRMRFAGVRVGHGRRVHHGAGPRGIEQARNIGVPRQIGGDHLGVGNVDAVRIDNRDNAAGRGRGAAQVPAQKPRRAGDKDGLRFRRIHGMRSSECGS
jgi:hypothetical protein